MVKERFFDQLVPEKYFVHEVKLHVSFEYVNHIKPSRPEADDKKENHEDISFSFLSSNSFTFYWNLLTFMQCEFSILLDEK